MIRPLVASTLVIGLAGIATSLPDGSNPFVFCVADDAFPYAIPGPLEGMNGGGGWLGPWILSSAVDSFVLFDNSISPAFPLSDGVGGHVGQVIPFEGASREFDLVGHPDLVDPVSNRFGADGNTFWISFSTVRFQGQPQENYGGLSLWNSAQGGQEVLFLGSPWDTAGWGIDDEGSAGTPPEIVPGTDNSVPARLVYRIDFEPGDERIRLYLNPPTSYPQGAADLDTRIADLRFDGIRLSSGGNNGDGFFWDNLQFAKGEGVGSMGSSYCGPASLNSSGRSGRLQASGSVQVVDNNVQLSATDLPVNAFGFFVVSSTQGFVMNPGGSSGNLCLGGAIGRYTGPGQIQSSGATGTFGLAIDLTATPQPTGSVSIAAGQSWSYQAWVRDAVAGMATSNFTNGLQIDYQ